MTAATDPPSLTEVLPEPGSRQLWVTFSDDSSRLVDLTPLLTTPPFQALKLTRLFDRARVDQEGRFILWPGGACLSAACLLQAPDGPLPVTLLARVPAAQRYRPLLPYLQHLDLPVYIRPSPIEATVIERLLHLKPGELGASLSRGAVPEAQMLGRLYDVVLFLGEHFGSDHLTALLRRPWRHSQLHCPGQPHLHTMLGCLLHGRPDLVEQPCRWLAIGPA